jgi:hypothetical protein
MGGTETGLDNTSAQDVETNEAAQFSEGDTIIWDSGIPHVVKAKKVVRATPGEVAAAARHVVRSAKAGAKLPSYTHLGEGDHLPDDEYLENWIAGAVKRPGQLHRDLGIAPGKSIPIAKIKAAAKRKDKVGARARFALSMHRMRRTREGLIREALAMGSGMYVPWSENHSHVGPGTKVKHASWRADQWDGKLTGRRRTAVDEHREYEVDWTHRHEPGRSQRGYHRREDLRVPSPEDMAGFHESARWVEALVDVGELDEAALEEAFIDVDLAERGGAGEAEYRARAAKYAGPGGGIGSKKREDIGHGKGRKYPPGFQHLRNELIDKGHTVADASRIAYGALRRWARGGGNVKPSTRAKAQKVLAQLHASPVSRHSEADVDDSEVIEALSSRERWKRWEAMHPGGRHSGATIHRKLNAIETNFPGRRSSRDPNAGHVELNHGVRIHKRHPKSYDQRGAYAVSGGGGQLRSFSDVHEAIAHALEREHAASKSAAGAENFNRGDKVRLPSGKRGEVVQHGSRPGEVMVSVRNERAKRTDFRVVHHSSLTREADVQREGFDAFALAEGVLAAASPPLDTSAAMEALADALDRD